MRRITSFYTVIMTVTLTSCLSDPVTPRPSDRQVDEDAIFAAVLDSLFRSAGTVVVLDSTLNGISLEQLAPVYWGHLADMRSVSAYMVNDFEQRNRVRRAVGDLPTRDIKVQAVPRSELSDLPHPGLVPRDPPRDYTPVSPYWEGFRERFGGARVLVRNSRPGFDASGSLAVIEVRYGCGMLCGGSYVVTLERVSNGWRVIEVNEVSVS